MASRNPPPTDPVEADIENSVDQTEPAKGSKKPKNFARRKDGTAFTVAEARWKTIRQAYDNDEEWRLKIESNWNIYNCRLDDNQSYSGFSQGYVPVVRDCVDARGRKILKQLFPVRGRNLEGVSSDGMTPYATISLLEYYIRQSGLRTTLEAMLTQGDVTGQWQLYVDWYAEKKQVTRVVEKQAQLDDGTPSPDDTYADIEDQEYTENCPDISVVPTLDVAVIPPTVDELRKAEIVVICHRYSETKVQSMIDRGVFVNVRCDELMEAFDQYGENPESIGVKVLEQLGIDVDGTDVHARVYEAHFKLTLDGEHREPAVVWYRHDGVPLGILANPYWCKRLPLISVPVKKQPGSFWGTPVIEPVRSLQWDINDVHNIGNDAAKYALNPVIMTDPQKNPQYQNLIMTMAAVWPTSPQDTQPLALPPVYQHAQQIIEFLKMQVRQSMNVTEYALGAMPQGRKNNSQVAAVGQEQEIGATDVASDVEDRVLNPLVELIFELDQQYRVDELDVLTRGEVGLQAHMERVKPQQFTKKYQFNWLGTDFTNSIARIQQKIAAMNVLRGVPPEALNGKRVDITPIIEDMISTVFGPQLAPKVIIDERDQLSMPASVEDELLANGFSVAVHPMDNDVAHMMSHMAGAQATGDPARTFAKHIMDHQKQMQQKAQIAGPSLNGTPGVPGGTGPGVAGTPRPGAQVMPLRNAQQPPGAIHQDQIASPDVMSRG